METPSPTRVLVLDDHPAVRAGLTAVLSAEPDLVAVAPAESAFDLWPKLYATAPHVVILDFHLPAGDGLALCAQLKREVPAPGVVLYSAFADERLLLRATLAGADALLSKGAETRELILAVRRVAGGERVLADVPGELLERLEARLEPEERPLLAMAARGLPATEIAGALGVALPEVRARVDRLVEGLGEAHGW